MKTIVKKYHKIWEWQVIQGRKVIAGGYGRTKKDATNDLNVWLRLNDPSSATTGPRKRMNTTETRWPGSMKRMVGPRLRDMAKLSARRCARRCLRTDSTNGTTGISSGQTAA